MARGEYIARQRQWFEARPVTPRTIQRKFGDQVAWHSRCWEDTIRGKVLAIRMREVLATKEWFKPGQVSQNEM